MKYQRQGGLTIPELMIGIALFSIVVSMAAPSFQNLMRRQELNSQMGLLNSTLAYARNEAISRQQNVAFCASSNGTSCLAASKDWSAGWLVFIDADNDGIADAGETILRRGGEAGGSASLRVADTNPSPLAIRYNQSGERESGVSTLWLCAGNADAGADVGKSKTITVSNVGSTRVAKGATCP